VIDKKLHVGGGACASAGVGILLESLRARCIRDRVIETVPGANADRTERAAHRLLLLFGRNDHAAFVAAQAKQAIEKAALLGLQRGRAILRAAIVLAERDQQ